MWNTRLTAIGRLNLRVNHYSDRFGGIYGIHEDAVFSTVEARSDLAPQMSLPITVVLDGADVSQEDGCVSWLYF